MGTTTREGIIAIEQKAVDRAYDCYAARLAELTGGSVASASASGKDGVANRLAAEERAAAYGCLGNASLVISRLDVQDGPRGEPDTWYVGRRAVSDVHTRDTVVVEWTNALAKKWLDALPDAPGEVLLRRRLYCTQRVVEGYADDISVAVADDISVSVAVPAPRPAADDAEPESAAADSATDAQQPEKARPPVLTPADIARLHRQKSQQPDARRAHGLRVRQCGVWPSPGAREALRTLYDAVRAEGSRARDLRNPHAGPLPAPALRGARLDDRPR